MQLIFLAHFGFFVVFYEELLGWALVFSFVLRDWANWDPAAGGFVELPNARLRMLGTVCVGPRGFHALLTDVQRLFQPKPLWDSSLFQLLCDPCMEITAAHWEAVSVLCFAWGSRLLWGRRNRKEGEFSVGLFLFPPKLRKKIN